MGRVQDYRSPNRTVERQKKAAARGLHHVGMGAVRVWIPIDQLMIDNLHLSRLSRPALHMPASGPDPDRNDPVSVSAVYPTIYVVTPWRNLPRVRILSVPAGRRTESSSGRVVREPLSRPSPRRSSRFLRIRLPFVLPPPAGQRRFASRNRGAFPQERTRSPAGPIRFRRLPRNATHAPDRTKPTAP